MTAEFAAAAATLWQYWNNPFLLRAVRAGWRGRNFVADLALQLGLLASVVVAVSAVASLVGPRGFAAWWGGSWGGLSLVLLSAVHFVMVVRGVGAGRRRDLLTDEAARGTLEPLLVTAMTRAEIILKSSVYPFLWAGVLALVALPLYVLCAATGDIGLGPVASLYMVYLMLALRPPVRLRHSVLANSRAQQTAFIIVAAVLLGIWLSRTPGGLSAGLRYGGIVVTWVYELASWLAAPVEWFGLRVPPLALLVLMYPFQTACGVLMAAAELETEGTAYLQALTKVRFWYRFVLGLAGMGYIWPLLDSFRVADALGLAGGLSSAYGVALAATVAAVAGSELLESARTRLDVCAGLGCTVRLGRTAAAHVLGGVVHALSPLLIVPVLHLLGCALGGEEPYPSGSRVILEALAAAAGAILVCYGLGLGVWLVCGAKPALRFGASAACLALVVALAWVGLYGVGGNLGRCIAALSPVAAFDALASSPSGMPGIPVRGYLFASAPVELPTALWCAGAQVLFAAALFAGDTLLLRRRLGARVAARGLVEPARGARPTRMSRFSLDILLERIENPVARHALVLARRSGAVLVAPVLLAVATVVALAGATAPTTRPWATPLLAVEPATGLQLTGWCVLGWVGYGVGLAASLVAAVSGGGALVEERRRRVFGFALLTPLADREIADGRFIAFGLPIGVGLVPALALALAGAIAAMSPLALLQWVFSAGWAVLAAVAVGYTGLGGAFGLRAAAGDGVAKALLLMGGLEAARWLLCLLSQAVCRAWPQAALGVAAVAAVTGLSGILLVAALARDLARGAAGRLRTTDPFAV